MTLTKHLNGKLEELTARADELRRASDRPPQDRLSELADAVVAASFEQQDGPLATECHELNARYELRDKTALVPLRPKFWSGEPRAMRPREYLLCVTKNHRHTVAEGAAKSTELSNLQARAQHQNACRDYYLRYFYEEFFLRRAAAVLAYARRRGLPVDLPTLVSRAAEVRSEDRRIHVEQKRHAPRALEIFALDAYALHVERSPYFSDRFGRVPEEGYAQRLNDVFVRAIPSICPPAAVLFGGGGTADAFPVEPVLELTVDRPAERSWPIRLGRLPGDIPTLRTGFFGTEPSPMCGAELAFVGRVLALLAERGPRVTVDEVVAESAGLEHCIRSVRRT